MALLVDTGALYALADADDSWHRRMKTFIQGIREALIVPAPVLVEAAYLMRERLGPTAERKFALSLAAGEMTVEDLSRADFTRLAELLAQYPFLGFVDASIVAVAERLKLKSLVTTDRRDFSRVVPKHVKAFELLP